VVVVDVSPTFLQLPEIIEQLQQLWPGTKLIHGKARHSQSQGGVERLNRTVQEKLGKWMVDSKSKAWSIGCKVVKWQVNSSFSASIGASPYYVTYGQEPRASLAHLPLSRELMATLQTEAQLCAAFHLPEDEPCDFSAIVCRGAAVPPTPEVDTSFQDEQVALSQDNTLPEVAEVAEPFCQVVAEEKCYDTFTQAELDAKDRLWKDKEFKVMIPECVTRKWLRARRVHLRVRASGKLEAKVSCWYEGKWLDPLDPETFPSKYIRSVPPLVDDDVPATATAAPVEPPAPAATAATAEAPAPAVTSATAEAPAPAVTSATDEPPAPATATAEPSVPSGSQPQRRRCNFADCGSDNAFVGLRECKCGNGPHHHFCSLSHFPSEDQYSKCAVCLGVPVWSGSEQEPAPAQQGPSQEEPAEPPRKKQKGNQAAVEPTESFLINRASQHTAELRNHFALPRRQEANTMRHQSSAARRTALR
jgi:hypothetical protein